MQSVRRATRGVSGVRWSEHEPQRAEMHTRQWIGTYGNRGNGDYQGELASALQAIKTAPLALRSHTRGSFGSSRWAIWRCGRDYSTRYEAGVYLITRGRTYGMLERPQLQRVLTHPPSARVTALNTGEVVALFDGGWLPLDEGLPQVRVIVARHAAPPPGKKVTVGKRVGEWVYELFITTLPVDGFLVEDALDWYHGRGAFEAVLADEDVEENPDRWCSYTECGQELWQIACQWLWNLRLSLGKMMQADALREIEWAPPKETTLLLPTPAPTPEEYGPWQLAGDVGRARGQIAGEAFVWQEDGKLRCPAGASLWLSEVRQENEFTQRAVYLAYQTDCQCCALREQCLAPGAKGNRARRVSVVRRLLPQPSSLERQPIFLGPMRWVDVAGRALRRRWTAHWRRHYVEVLPLPQTLPETKPPPRPPRALRQAPSLPLARSVGLQCRLGTTASAYQCSRCSRFSRQQLTKEEWPTQEACFKR